MQTVPPPPPSLLLPLPVSLLYTHSLPGAQAYLRTIDWNSSTPFELEHWMNPGVFEWVADPPPFPVLPGQVSSLPSY